jgi:hypothetical protein
MTYEWPEDEEVEEFSGDMPDLRSAMLGLGAYMGTKHAIKPITSIPGRKYDALAAKRPMTSPAKTQLQSLAEFTRAEVDAIQNFAKKQGVKAPILSAGPGAATSYVESRGGKIDHVGLGRASVPSAMHEIGHATPILGSSKLRNASFTASGMSRGAPGAILRGLLAANILRGKQEEGGAIENAAYDYAPALMGASYAPMLLEEARATAHAVKGGRALGKGMETLKDLAPGYGTYAAKALTPILAALVAKKVVEAIRGIGNEKKAAAQVRASGLLQKSMGESWRMHPSAAGSKTTRPTTASSPRAQATTKLRPRSNVTYHKDTIKSFHNPQRGFRIAKS